MMEKLKWFSYFLLLAAGHGLILIAVLNKIPNKNKPANTYLSVLIGLVITALVGRLAFDPSLFGLFPHLVIVADIIIFLFGPIFYFYIRSILGLPPMALQRQLLHFIPAMVHLATMIPQIIIDQDTYIQMMMVDKTPWLYAVWFSCEGLALAINFGYLYFSYQLFKKQPISPPLLQLYRPYIKNLLLLMTICLVGWLQGYVLYFFGLHTTWSFVGSNIAWIIPSAITYYLGYLMAVKPSLFQEPVLPKVKYQNSSLGDSEVEQTKARLEAFMVAQRPYLQSDLTLGALAKMLDLKPASLSRVINECYNKNFFDFTNAYRLQYFIEMVRLDEYRHKTLLGIALEAGFNSKSTFNRAFKKEYDMPPTAYFKQANLTID
ncbi:helix-turn-helix domain-containing protein [uncultured Microscilla sp.]|uniref:AraC family transcriptional regulator n=1 Tax=uncultured Microscilla sp. TaxID=432653 RepID=UPI002633CBB2|nr:helix-turn-helix domain-containing protein [uncultured Microscilla sp.]